MTFSAVEDVISHLGPESRLEIYRTWIQERSPVNVTDYLTLESDPELFEKNLKNMALPRVYSPNLDPLWKSSLLKAELDRREKEEARIQQLEKTWEEAEMKEVDSLCEKLDRDPVMSRTRFYEIRRSTYSSLVRKRIDEILAQLA